MRLVASLDQVYADAFPADLLEDSVEGKLFGVGSESFVAGSHEFYIGFALTRGLMVCLDTGHNHPILCHHEIVIFYPTAPLLRRGLLLIGMGDFARQMVTGLIIVAAVVLDTYRAKFSVEFQ
jgi:hypothetical protein